MSNKKNDETCIYVFTTDNTIGNTIGNTISKKKGNECPIHKKFCSRHKYIDYTVNQNKYITYTHADDCTFCNDSSCHCGYGKPF